MAAVAALSSSALLDGLARWAAMRRRAAPSPRSGHPAGRQTLAVGEEEDDSDDDRERRGDGRFASVFLGRAASEDRFVALVETLLADVRITSGTVIVDAPNCDAEDTWLRLRRVNRKTAFLGPESESIWCWSAPPSGESARCCVATWEPERDRVVVCYIEK